MVPMRAINLVDIFVLLLNSRETTLRDHLTRPPYETTYRDRVKNNMLHRGDSTPDHSFFHQESGYLGIYLSAVINGVPHSHTPTSVIRRLTKTVTPPSWGGTEQAKRQPFKAG